MAFLKSITDCSIGEYVSCIKVKGVVSILPPLITDEKRLQIQKYKQQALEVQKRLENSSYQKAKPSISVPNSDSVLSIEGLNVTLHNAETSNQNDPGNGDTHVPYEPYTKTDNRKGTPNLTFNIVDISEYNINGYCSYIPDMEERFMCPNQSQPEIVSDSEITSFTNRPDNLADKPTVKINNCIDNQFADATEPQPRLRSNSYVLESPSPAILEMLKEQDISNKASKETCSDALEQKLDCDRLCDDNSKWLHNESADSFLSASYDLENTLDCTFPSMNSNLNSPRDLEDISGSCIQEILNLLERPVSDKIQDCPVPQSGNEDEENELLIDFSKDIENVAANTCCDNWAGVQVGDCGTATSCISSVDLDSWMYSPSPPVAQYKKSEVTTATAVLVEFESDYDSTTSVSSEVVNAELTEIQSVSSKSIGTDHKTKQEWAATILCAAVRGYLIRRLKRTKKVQMLIQTITEALIYADSLHGENYENINSADVELHQRLIQQVSAACSSFYDIFFSSSVSEQMTMIAQDRLMQIERQNRSSPALSARSSQGGGSKRSTPRLVRHAGTMTFSPRTPVVHPA